MINRTTPSEVQNLTENQVFVFGSNSEGNHAGGAAKTAKDKFGAIDGQSCGLQGQSYGINTMDGIDTIEVEIEDFIIFAKQNPNTIFLITEIGCGIAGFKIEEIAPLFFSAKEIKNIHLPESF